MINLLFLFYFIIFILFWLFYYFILTLKIVETKLDDKFF